MGDLARTEEDVLAYILYPATMEKFLRSKYGIDSSKSSGVENIPKKK